ncbi:MAG: DUF3631 domain-containing protein [Acidimicrobiales bacterium]
MWEGSVGSVNNIGAPLLNDIESYLSRFVAYPSDEARVAHVLWIVHTHRMDLWESTPRIAFLSPEPGSGKSRALEVTEPLVPMPVHAVNTTSAYLFRKVADPEGLPTLLYDEIDTVFGPKAKENEDVRGMLNAGHRKGAKAGRCVVKGATIVTEELDAYCAVALAGLDDLPDTLMTRSVVIRMRRRAPHEVVEPFRHRVNAPEGAELRRRLMEWTRKIPMAWPDMPAQIADRAADCWEPLIAVADAAGGDWPERARCSAVTHVTLSKAAPPSIGVRLLTDLRTVFDEAHSEHMFTEEILEALVEMELSPWADIRGKALDARSLSRRLSKYGISPKLVRIGEKVARGYTRGDLADTWSRYVAVPDYEATEIPTNYIGNKATSESAKESVTSVTPLQPGTVRPKPEGMSDADYFNHFLTEEEFAIENSLTTGWWDGTQWTNDGEEQTSPRLRLVENEEF